MQHDIVAEARHGSRTTLMEDLVKIGCKISAEKKEALALAVVGSSSSSSSSLSGFSSSSASLPVNANNANNDDVEIRYTANVTHVLWRARYPEYVRLANKRFESNTNLAGNILQTLLPPGNATPRKSVPKDRFIWRHKHFFFW